MPVIIDPVLFPNLDQLHATRGYPAELVNYLWPTDPTVAAAFQLATSSTYNPTRNGVDITWYGFKAKNKRLPEFYAIELSAAQTAFAVSLYDIAAVGNTSDVDILVTNATGVFLGNALFENGVPAVLVAAGSKANSYEAKKAHWIPDNPHTGAVGHCTTPMELDLTRAAIPAQPVILWAVTYRHGRYGSRPNPGWDIPIVLATGGLVQDDDGSPGDPEPGGED